MTKYRITTPDGRKYIISGGKTPPTPAQIRALIENYPQPVEKPAFSLKPLTAEEKARAAVLAKAQRPRKTLGEKAASFMVTNPLSRTVGLGMQGISNASFNPSGYIARSAGWDMAPLQAQNAAERAIEKGAQYGYDMAALSTLGNGAKAVGLLGKGKGALSIGAQTMLAPELMPAVSAATGGGIAEGIFNPQTAGGKFAANVIGGSPLMPVRATMGTARLAGKGLSKTLPVLSGVSEKSYQKAFDIGKAEQIAKGKIKYLTDDPNLSILTNKWNRFTGRGKTIDDILAEENQRLVRQGAKADKVANARKAYNENSQSSYDFTRPPDSMGMRLNRWQPTKDFKGALDAPLSFNEYTPNMENASRFHKAMSDFKKIAGPTGEQVSQYSPEEYAQMRTFLTDDGKAGFAIRPDGDIVSVFKSGQTPKGAGDAIMEAAVSAGGKKLDAYDTFLPEIYSRHGFKEVGRDTWNPQYAPEKWNKRAMKRFNLGEPDIVYMEHDPNYFGNYQSPNSLQNVVNRLNADVTAGQSLRRGMNGEKSVRSIVDDANEALRNIKTKAVEEYQKQRDVLFSDETKLDISDILESVKNNREKLTYKGIPVAGNDTLNMTNGMFNAVERFQNENTMAGLDAMKRAIQNPNTVNDDLARNIQTDLVNTIKGTIRKQDAGYSDMLDGYRGAMESINDLKAGLNVGSQNKETTARSILQAMRDNVNTNFGSKYDLLQQLEQQGGKELTSALVGQEFRSPAPRGLSKLISGATVLGGFYNPTTWAALPLSSPRLTGEATYRLGRAAGALNPYISQIPKQRYYDLPYWSLRRYQDD